MAERSVLHVLPHAGGGGDTYIEVLRAMSGYRFDHVYVTQSRKPGLGEMVSSAPELRRTLRGYDLLHVHGEGAAGLFLPLLAARRSVVTLHGLHLLRRVDGFPRQVATLSLRGVVRAASRTICVSHAERKLLESIVGARGTRRAVVVHNGARVAAPPDPAERQATRAELGLEESAAVGIWVGSLDERRDPVAVIRAAEDTATPLLLVGDGPLRAEAERAATGQVHILGQRQDVDRLLDAADFFVLMSEREGLSFALVEAMGHGLPAIVADIEENVEAVGETGAPVPYGDRHAIAAAMHRFSGDAAWRRALGEQARQRVADLFLLDDMIARTRAVYGEVLDSP